VLKRLARRRIQSRTDPMRPRKRINFWQHGKSHDRDMLGGAVCNRENGALRETINTD
jgi:hypothetical protein